MNRKFGKSLLTSAVFAGLMLGGVSGCIVREEPAPVTVGPGPGPAPADEEVVAPVAPPADIVEVQPAMPAPGYVWIGGFWGWNGGRYAWRHGYWHAGYGGHVWVRDGWVRGPRGYAWRHGYWR